MSPLRRRPEPLGRAVVAAQVAAFVTALAVGLCLFGWTVAMQRLIGPSPPGELFVEVFSRIAVICFIPLLVVNPLTAIAVLVVDRNHTGGWSARMAAGVVAIVAPGVPVAVLGGATVMWTNDPLGSPFAAMSTAETLLLVGAMGVAGLLNLLRTAVWSGVLTSTEHRPLTRSVLVGWLVLSCLMPWVVFLFTDSLVFSSVYHAVARRLGSSSLQANGPR